MQCAVPSKETKSQALLHLQRDGAGGFRTGLGRLEACAGKWILNLEASFDYLPVLQILLQHRFASGKQRGSEHH